MSTDPLRTLLNSLEAELPRAVTLRERLHSSPEPSHEEHETARLVAEGLGTPDASRVAGTGLVARAGPADLPAVAVRAELDALPIPEETGAPFAARNGLMHACGHDVHMAALTALLRAARRVEASLPKPLIALYQPSEETHPLGADLVVREGTLAAAAAVVAAHVHPDVPWGAVSVEDLLQDTFAQAFRDIGQFDLRSERSLRAWLCTWPSCIFWAAWCRPACRRRAGGRHCSASAWA